MGRPADDEDGDDDATAAAADVPAATPAEPAADAAAAADGGAGGGAGATADVPAAQFREPLVKPLDHVSAHLPTGTHVWVGNMGFKGRLSTTRRLCMLVPPPTATRACVQRPPTNCSLLYVCVCCNNSLTTSCGSSR